MCGRACPVSSRAVQRCTAGGLNVQRVSTGPLLSCPLQVHVPGKRLDPECFKAQPAASSRSECCQQQPPPQQLQAQQRMSQPASMRGIHRCGQWGVQWGVNGARAERNQRSPTKPEQQREGMLCDVCRAATSPRATALAASPSTVRRWLAPPLLPLSTCSRLLRPAGSCGKGSCVSRPAGQRRSVLLPGRGLTGGGAWHLAASPRALRARQGPECVPCPLLLCMGAQLLGPRYLSLQSRTYPVKSGAAVTMRPLVRRGGVLFVAHSRRHEAFVCGALLQA